MGQQRHISTDAVILKTAIINEHNKRFSFISPVMGIQEGIAFGAAGNKNKFCSSVSPFVRAKLFLYKNHKSVYYKLEDISEVFLNDNFNKDLKSIYLLSFFSEILLNSFIGGEEIKNYYFLLLYSTELLEKSRYEAAFIFFTTKFLFLSGYNYSLSYGCRKCGKEFDFYYFDHKDGSIMCFQDTASNKFKISKESVILWKDFFENKYSLLKTAGVEKGIFNELFPLITFLLMNIFEKNLKTIDFLKDVF
jgi:DNA repair protein RecO